LGKLKKYLSPSLQHDLANSFISFKDIDWEHTKAFAYGEYGQIFINLKGREPQGIVKPGEEYEQLLNEITHRLLKLIHPETGERMIQEVYRKDALYHGPMVEKAPDLTFAIGDFRYDSSVRFGLGLKEIFGPPEFEDSGTHRREGVFIASGPGIKNGYKIEKAKLFDIAPTTLYLFDLPIPTDMDGELLLEIFKEGWLKNHPPRYKPEGMEKGFLETNKGISTEETEAIKKGSNP
jgi:predicted AlkP superfamily phosphohydrolase/phosphomutase